MSELRILDRTGDTKIEWDEENSEEVAVAQEKFKELKDEGYDAYSVDGKGKKIELITEFDKSLAGIIMVPRLVGG